MTIRIADEATGTPADDLILSGIGFPPDGTYQVRRIQRHPWTLPMLGSVDITRRRYAAQTIDGATGRPTVDAGTDTTIAASVQAASDDIMATLREGDRGSEAIVAWYSDGTNHWRAVAVRHQPMEATT